MTDYKALYEKQLAENKKLKEDLAYEKKVSFWRMCEAHNGFHKNTCFDREWMNEMNAMIEDRWDNNAWCEASVEELQAGYREWVDYESQEEEDSESE